MSTPVTFSIEAVDGGYQAFMTPECGDPLYLTDIYTSAADAAQSLADQIYGISRWDLSSVDHAEWSAP